MKKYESEYFSLYTTGKLTLSDCMESQVNAPSFVSTPMVARVAEVSQPLILATNNISNPTLQSVNLWVIYLINYILLLSMRCLSITILRLGSLLMFGFKQGASSKDQVNSKFYPKSSTLAVGPDFLQLSLPNFPVQQPAMSPSLDNSDLELSIAPPQPHSLARLPPQPAAGAIRVI